ncbi:MAG: GGDEF domain-containing protein [Magnetococcales bacterium]|nr:GGDEF domain-containing protein [Magnetococcales bacterium]
MIDDKLVPYVVGMTKQTDRTSLIFHLISSINKWLKTEGARYFDIHWELFQDGLGDEPIKRYILLEPLHEKSAAIPSATIEGVDRCLAKRPEHHLALLVKKGRSRRYVIPIGRESEFKSILIVDFPVSAKEKPQLIWFFLEMFNNLQEIIKAKDQDPLTGLFNRRSFDETISCVLDAASHTSNPNRTSGEGACLAIFDIDHFKRVNDVFGHSIGDEVLILFARLMERIFRHGDKLYRFGGEEFLAILVEVDQEKALQALERFRSALEEYSFPQVNQVTVSIGSIMVNQDDFPSVLIEKADKALYYAKENGRNQVRSYDQLIEAGDIAAIEHAADDIELW